MTDKINSTEWLDKITFVVHFTPQEAIENNEKILNEVIAEYHKDEDKWVLEECSYSLDGEFLDSISLDKVKSPYDVAIYKTMAEGAYFAQSNAWNDIVVDDDYKSYDALMDRIKGHYGCGREDMENDVEDFVNAKFIDLLHDLDEEFTSPLAYVENDIREIFTDFDTEIIEVSTFGIIHQGAQIDFITLDDDNYIHVWCGENPYNEDSKHVEELILTDDDRLKIYKELLEVL